MSRFASALSEHPDSAAAVGEVCGAVLEELAGATPDLVVCFASPHLVDAMPEVVPALREALQPRVLFGGTAESIISRAREIESSPAFSVFAAVLPGAVITPVELEVVGTPDGPSILGWPDLETPPDTLLLFADPFSLPVDEVLRDLAEHRPGLHVIGGFASAASRPGGNRLVLDGTVTPVGGVGAFLAGAQVGTVVSQGCRPIGRPYVVTRGDRNVVAELGGKPALARLRELASNAPPEDRALMAHGLHVGFVVDERKEEFARGDFLVRGVLGADEASGALAVGGPVVVGQTVQFHVRDAAAADEDLRALLEGAEADGALMFSCNGRGRHLFGVPDHDAGVLASLLGPIPAAGAFCAGEIGPVGGQNFVHSFTASLALFS